MIWHQTYTSMGLCNSFSSLPGLFPSMSSTRGTGRGLYPRTKKMHLCGCYTILAPKGARRTQETSWIELDKMVLQIKGIPQSSFPCSIGWLRLFCMHKNWNCTNLCVLGSENSLRSFLTRWLRNKYNVDLTMNVPLMEIPEHGTLSFPMFRDTIHGIGSPYCIRFHNLLK